MAPSCSSAMITVKIIMTLWQLLVKILISQIITKSSATFTKTENYWGVMEMNYEYNESLKEDLQHLYEIPTGVWKYKEKLEELDEVYAKAQAFDEIVRCMEHQQAYDLTDSMVMQDIDYAIRKLFTEVEQ